MDDRLFHDSAQFLVYVPRRPPRGVSRMGRRSAAGPGLRPLPAPTGPRGSWSGAVAAHRSDGGLHPPGQGVSKAAFVSGLARTAVTGLNETKTETDGGAGLADTHGVEEGARRWPAREHDGPWPPRTFAIEHMDTRGGRRPWSPPAGRIRTTGSVARPNPCRPPVLPWPSGLPCARVGTRYQPYRALRLRLRRGMLRRRCPSGSQQGSARGTRPRRPSSPGPRPRTARRAGSGNGCHSSSRDRGDSSCWSQSA